MNLNDFKIVPSENPNYFKCKLLKEHAIEIDILAVCGSSCTIYLTYKKSEKFGDNPFLNISYRSDANIFSVGFSRDNGTLVTSRKVEVDSFNFWEVVSEGVEWLTKIANEIEPIFKDEMYSWDCSNSTMSQEVVDKILQSSDDFKAQQMINVLDRLSETTPVTVELYNLQYLNFLRSCLYELREGE